MCSRICQYRLAFVLSCTHVFRARIYNYPSSIVGSHGTTLTPLTNDGVFMDVLSLICQSMFESCLTAVSNANVCSIFVAQYTIVFKISLRIVPGIDLCTEVMPLRASSQGSA